MAEVQRPLSITLVEIFAIVSGLLGVAAGIAAIADRETAELIDKTQLTPDQILWAGVIMILFGVIKVLLATALGRGNEIVRVIFAFVAAVNLGSGIWGMLALHGEQQASATVSAVFAALVLWLLFNQQSQAYFDKVNR